MTLKLFFTVSKKYLWQSKNICCPDGRIQTVSYTVDGGAGYVADVTYTGEAHYPDTVAPAPGYSA